MLTRPLSPLAFAALAMCAGLALPAHAAPIAPQAAACDRACLSDVMDGYFDSLARHDVSRLAVSPRLKATQNSAPVKLGEGLWRKAGAVSYRLDAVDPRQGQAAAQAVLLEDGKPVMLFVRLGLAGRAINEIETIVIRQGEGQRSNPTAMKGRSALYDQTIPADQRQSRDSMVAAGQAYLDALATSGTPAYMPPPLADDMARIENGAGGRSRTTVVEQLRQGFGPPGQRASLKVTDRRIPVVDEERGIVLIIGIMNLDLPPGTADFPGVHAVSKTNRKQTLVEFFKVTGGLVREIQAVMYDLDDPAHQNTGW